MRNTRRNLNAIVIAGVSFILVIGAMLTALADTGFSPAPSSPIADTIIPIFTPTADGQADTPIEEAATDTPEDRNGSTTPSAAADSPTSTSSVVTKSPTSSTPSLTPTAEQTEVSSCTKPIGWVNYVVQTGDTLFSIAIRHQTTVTNLQTGNCMGSSTKIITGSTLWVPNNPTITPSKTAVPTNTKLVCYTLTLSITGNGSELVASPQKSDGCTTGSYVAGEEITLTASPAAGWTIGSWNGTDDDASIAKTNLLTMPAKNHSASVTYVSPTCYTLTLSHTGNGSNPTASPKNSTGCSTGSYIAGEKITLSAVADTGWRVAGWAGTKDDASTAVTNSVTMPAKNHTASVTYEAICYTLTLSFTGAGSVPTASPTNSPSCPLGSFVVGVSITLSAIPDSGGSVTGWTGTNDDGSTALTNTWTMQASDHEVTVHYSP